MAVKNIVAKGWTISASYDGRLYSEWPAGNKPNAGYWGSGGTDWYISPTGSDANNGLSSGAPKKTFANVFAAMAAGDQLYLMDGTYSVAAGTGYISYLGTNSAQPISGLSLARSTRVKAINDGQVTITGGLFLGRSFASVDYVEVWGCKFVDNADGAGAGSIYNGTHNSIKNCGFIGGFGIGTNDAITSDNTYNLVEDSWCTAAGIRIIVANYQANKNIWRRFVFRGDGCGTAACTGSGNPNVGFTVYDSQDCTLANVIGIDRLLAATPNADYPYADFATAQHTPGVPLRELGRNKWLGCISIGAPDGALNFEADTTIAGATTWTVTNFACVTNGIDGPNFGASGPVVLNGLTSINAGTAGNGLRVAPSSPGTSSVTNVLTRGGFWGLNSSITPQYTSVYGASSSAYNQTTPTVGVHVADQYADGTPASLKYPVRIETGSALKDVGASGADIGATIMYCIGADGARFGDADAETMQSVPLWPWPNEARIKADFAAVSGGARGFCTGTSMSGASQSLTKYIWEKLGNQAPADYYSGWAA
jgi:hypothetical protein